MKYKMNTIRKLSIHKLSVFFLSFGCLLGLVFSLRMLIWPVDFFWRFQINPFFFCSFQLDILSAYFLVILLFISLLTVIYSFHYFKSTEKPFKIGLHYFFFGLLILSMCFILMAHDFITFAFMWEMMSLSSLFLVLFDHENKEVQKAGYLYFVFSQFGLLMIVFAFGLIYSVTGSLEFQDLAFISEPLKSIIFLVAFVGFGSKAGIFPVHIWLPYAHPAAPSPISALMSGVMIKMGIYGILRMFFLLNVHSLLIANIVLFTGIISGILGVIYALGQHQLKRILAYHSVENIGIILMGLGIGMLGLRIHHFGIALLGFSGCLLHVLNHAVFKSLLFMGAGIVLQKTHQKNIDKLGGLLKTFRITGITFLVGSLAIVGLPLLNGFISEFLIYYGAFQGLIQRKFLYFIFLLSILALALIGGLALACFTKVFGVVFLGEPRVPLSHTEEQKDPPFLMLLPLVILAGTCFVIGLFPFIFVKKVMAISQYLIYLNFSKPVQMDYVFHMMQSMNRVFLVFGGLLLMLYLIRKFLLKAKVIRFTETWGCGFTKPNPKMQYTGASFVSELLHFFKGIIPMDVKAKPVKGVFPTHASFYSEVQDLGEQSFRSGVIRSVFFLFNQFRWIQLGNIHLYIAYIFFAIIGSILLFLVL